VFRREKEGHVPFRNSPSVVREISASAQIQNQDLPDPGIPGCPGSMAATVHHFLHQPFNQSVASVDRVPKIPPIRADQRVHSLKTWISVMDRTSGLVLERPFFSPEHVDYI
jgi:hypothetical protein